MADVTWIPGGLIGFREVWIEEGEGKKEYVSGAIVALRKGGDEALFARNDDEEDDKGNYKHLEPLRWIPISEFCASPVAIATEDDFVSSESEEEETSFPRGQFDVVSAPSGPSGSRKSGGVRRRGE